MKTLKTLLISRFVNHISQSYLNAKDEKGRVAVPILLYFLGVPGFLCLLLWFFFFKG